MTRVAVVGHVEWVTFVVAPCLPQPGEILEAADHFAAAGGGGGVAAVRLTELAGACTFLTSLGDDLPGRRAAEDLRERGVDLHAAAAGMPQREGFTFLTDDHERTITVCGERHVPHRADDLPWDALSEVDAIYFTGGDVDALRAARAARVLVATPRALDTIRAAGVELDVLVASATDQGEQVDVATLDPRPRFVVLTDGGDGGTWTGPDGASGTWAAAQLPGPPVDAYGCGDTFAAALTYGLGDGRSIDDALALAARCGAAVLTGRGPYAAPLPPA